MALDIETLKSELNAALGPAIATVFEDSYDELFSQMKDNSGGFETALIVLKNKATSFLDPANNNDLTQYETYIRRIIAEEWSKAVSKSLIDVFVDQVAPALSDAISEAISTPIDSYIKSAEISVPSGIPVTVGGSGQQSYSGETTESSGNAEIN